MKTVISALLFACFCLPAIAGEPAVMNSTGSQYAPSDLTLFNFFSEGWTQEWGKRSNPDAAPDMALLRVQTNFLEREIRTDYYFKNDISSASKKDIHFADTLIAWGLNRRLMLEAVASYEWVEPRAGKKEMEGMSEAFVGRLQLIDTATSSYAFNFRAQAPDNGIGNHQTTLSYGIAGWNDLTSLGLKRMGLYYHVQEETYLGTGEKGAKKNDLTYAVSVAKTWTAPDAAIRNFTTFVEGYATTDLDGTTSGHTAMVVTPGIRFTLGRGNVFMTGADIPLTSPIPYSAQYRLTYIYNF